MHRIDTPGSQSGTFVAGNPIAGVESTIVGADWPNAVQEEIAAVIEGAGFSLTKTNNAQLRTAIQSMIDAGSSPVGWLNVRTDYLARGDGIADDTSEIQAAIDAATTNGGTVYIPRGTYKVTSALVLKPNVTIIGDGRAAIVDLAHDGNGLDVQASATGCRVTNVAFKGRTAGTPVTQRGAIRVLGGVTDCMIDHVWLQDVVNCGIVVAGSTTTVNLQIDTVQIDGTGEHGILVLGDPRRVTLSNVIALNVGGVSGGIGSGVGIKVDEAQDVQIVNAFLEGDSTNGAHGLVIGPDSGADAVARVHVSNVTAKATTTTATHAGLLIQNDTADVVVVGSRFEGPRGVRLNGTGATDRPFQTHLLGLHVISTDATALYALQVEWAEEVYVSGGFYRSGSSSGAILRVEANATHVFLDGIFTGDKTDTGVAVQVANSTTYVDRIHQRSSGLQGTSLVITPQTTQDSLSVLPVNDTTPTVAGKRFLRTANTSATTISDFDDGTIGQKIVVLVNDANTTLDFTASNLRGNNGVDWAVPNGESFWAIYDGSKWWISKHA